MLTDFNDFWCVKSWENLTSTACTFAHSSVYCSHFTLGNPKSHFSTVLSIHTYYLHYLRRNQTVTALPTTPEKCHHTTLWNAQHSHLTEYMCVSPNVGGFEMSRLWVDIGGSEKNWLWCAANGMSGKQRYSKCSKWPPSARVHASRLFCHWSTVSSTTLCWNSAHVTIRRFRSTTRPYSESVLDTREQMKKMKNLCNFYKAVGRHFSGVVGKELTVCFFR